jgi:hypothetical protein
MYGAPFPPDDDGFPSGGTRDAGTVERDDAGINAGGRHDAGSVSDAGKQDASLNPATGGGWNAEDASVAVYGAPPNLE